MGAERRCKVRIKEQETRSGVAVELAKVNTPQIVIGGGQNAKSANPMDAVGVNMLLEVMGKLEKN